MSDQEKQIHRHKDLQENDEAELNYRIIAEYASDAIIRIDSNSKILFVNKETERIFGHKKNELIGRNLTLLIPDNLIKAHRKGIQRYLETGEKKLDWNRVEIPGKHKDGSEVSLEMSFGEYAQGTEKYFVGVIRDVTSRNENLKKIRESESVLQGTLDALTAHIAVLDNEGIIRKVNKAWLDFARANEFNGEYYGIGSSYLKECQTTIDAPEECQLLGQDACNGIKDVINENIPLFEMEYPCHSPTEKRWFIMRVTPNSNEKTGVVVAHENITKRKLAEEKTQISEAKYRVLSEAIPAFMFVTNNEGYTTFANRQWCDYTGFTEEQTLGTGWTDAIHPRDISSVMDKWRVAVDQKTIFEAEYRFRRHDGLYRWFLVRVIPRKNSAGNILEWFGTGTDIEDRKIIEEELRSSENFNRVVLESSPDCVKLLDEKGNLQYMNANGVCLMEIDDFTKYENTQWVDLWEEENKTLVESAVEAALKGNTARFQANSPTAKGTRKWWDVIVLPIDESGSEENAPKLISVSRDITETKRINEALLKSEVEQRQQAEAANLAKDEFLSVLSHELRTPLNAMLGWVRMLKTGTLDKDRKVQAVEVIERNIILQNELIEDLLDVSRIISGKMLIEKEVIEMQPIISNAFDIARPLADKKNISISFNNSIGFEKILGDKTRLHQVILNLLNNAIKFTPNDGSINLDLSKTEKSLVLKIIDTGVGIEHKFLPSIFERFSQADSTTKRTYSGLGLGLTIVNHLTKLHNGEVVVYSEGKGKGSVFTLTLPIHKVVQEHTSKIAIKHTNESGNSYLLKDLRILLVDDDIDGLIPLQILLEQEKTLVQTANSVSEAMSLLAEMDFDILISDIGMPETDGYEFIQQLRKSNRNNAIPAIALTAYASLTDKEKAIKIGFQKHIAKPLDLNKLIEILEQMKENLQKR